MEEQKDLLSDIEHQLVHTPATPGLRFANYVIDVIVFYAVIFVFGMLGAGIMNPNNLGVLYLFTFSILIAYYTIMEGATRGKTVGKMITGTRAVKEDGSAITLRDAFLRTLCRLVPFEPFSTFGGRPWHDRWTNTIVIKE